MPTDAPADLTPQGTPRGRPRPAQDLGDIDWQPEPPDAPGWWWICVPYQGMPPGGFGEFQPGARAMCLSVGGVLDARARWGAEWFCCPVVVPTPGEYERGRREALEDAARVADAMRAQEDRHGDALVAKHGRDSARDLVARACAGVLHTAASAIRALAPRPEAAPSPTVPAVVAGPDGVMRAARVPASSLGPFVPEHSPPPPQRVTAAACEHCGSVAPASAEEVARLRGLVAQADRTIRAGEDVIATLREERVALRAVVEAARNVDDDGGGILWLRGRLAALDALGKGCRDADR